MAFTVSGLASGFDWESIVNQLTEVERAPQARLRSQQTTIQERNNVLGSLKTQMSVLQNRIKTLKEGAVFDGRSVSVSNASAASATATKDTPLGSYVFSVTQAAKAAVLNGTADIGSRLNATNDVSALALSDAAFRTPVTAGTFTVNGRQITVATGDTLQGVFDKISAATSGAVTATYNSTTDQIRLTGGSEIILGSATDTSNFLQVAKLANNGTGTVESSTTLGSVRTNRELAASNLATGLTATGEFKINGVTFTYDSAVDSLDNLLNRINASTAGVNASYDSTQDRILLTNRVPGDLGIGLEDVSGNFLAASGLTTGTLQRGRNLQYSINGGGTLTSASNTISEVSSGITGLNVTVQSEGTFTVGVTNDSNAIKSAIKGFVDEYNKTQALININSASTTDSKGKVTAGALSADSTVSSMNSDLRRLMTGTLSGLSGTILRMESLGYTSNGNDDSLIASEESQLDKAIASDLSSLKDFFTNASTGLATQFNTYLDKTIGEGGTLVTRQNNLTAEAKKIDDSIVTMERVVQANKARLTQSFLAMETAQSNINQQLSYLQRYFGQ